MKQSEQDDKRSTPTTSSPGDTHWNNQLIEIIQDFDKRGFSVIGLDASASTLEHARLPLAGVIHLSITPAKEE